MAAAPEELRGTTSSMDEWCGLLGFWLCGGHAMQHAGYRDKEDERVLFSSDCLVGRIFNTARVRPSYGFFIRRCRFTQLIAYMSLNG